MKSAALLLVLLSSIAAVGCAAAPPNGPSDTSEKGNNNNESKDEDGNKDPVGGFGNNTETPPAATDNPNGQPSEVWGHGPDTLYRLDPNTKAVTIVGTFSGCGNGNGVMDIALDAESKLFATTADGLWSVNKQTAACTRIATGSYPNSLSFVPKGTVDANVEALVGYEGGTYVRIDPQTGVKTRIGSIGGGLESSGDIVSVKGGSTYLTVTGGSSCSRTDCLIEVNPTTGAMVKNWGSIGREGVYGLAFWAGKVYAFDTAGELLEVSFDGGTLATNVIPVPKNNGASGAIEFWGAGSTTSAPVGGVN